MRLTVELTRERTLWSRQLRVGILYDKVNPPEIFTHLLKMSVHTNERTLRMKGYTFFDPKIFTVYFMLYFQPGFIGFFLIGVGYEPTYLSRFRPMNKWKFVDMLRGAKKCGSNIMHSGLIHTSYRQSSLRP